MNQEQERVLKELIRNLDTINQELSPWIDKNNIFKILKINNYEIRHSEYLSYLLDPTNGYGWKDEFFKKFMLNVIDEIEIEIDNCIFDEFDIVLKDYSDLKIYREHRNIDLLLISKNREVVICIENKIWTSEHDNQLNRYYEYINDAFSAYKKIYLYLSPNGEIPESKEWMAISYKTVLNTCRIMYEDYKDKIEANLKILLEDYIEVLDGGVVMNDELSNKCSEIYYKYKDALDLIYDNKVDILSRFLDVYKEALKELENENKILIRDDLINKSFIRFTTPALNNFFDSNYPNEFKENWNDDFIIRYEIIHDERFKFNVDDNNLGDIKLWFYGDGLEERRKIIKDAISRNKKQNSSLLRSDNGKRYKETWNNLSFFSNQSIEFSNDQMQSLEIGADNEARKEIVNHIKKELLYILPILEKELEEYFKK